MEEVRIIRWIDGDTCIVEAEGRQFPWDEYPVKGKHRLRCIGYNCPEVKTPQGLAALNHVRILAPEGQFIYAKHGPRRLDKYGRWLAELIHTDPNRPQLAQAMISVGHARPTMFGDDAHGSCDAES
jgi:endonuclease YncB( thermonuclease family)